MRKRVLCTLLPLVLAAGSCGFSCKPSTSGQVAEPPPLADLPVELTVRQRSATVVPGSDGRLRLRIQDVTRNQVVVVLEAGEKEVLAPTSMSPGATLTFDHAGRSYALTLSGLSNALVGDDFATFTIADAVSAALTEAQKIERLIEMVGDMNGAVFIRNDVEHDPREAADHLRLKWRAKADDIDTAVAFIDLLATRSSMTGRPYQIRLSTGETVPAGAYLHEKLREIEREE